MASVTLYTSQGEEKGKLELDDRLFGVAIKPELVYSAVVAQTANSRKVLAHTKTRGEVAGTGKKPWKQKGTGRARHGSRRSPIWIGGGITFGPRKDRNFSIKINKKAKQKALSMVLSDKVANDKLIAMESLDVTGGKTKELIKVLRKLPEIGRKTLIVTEPGQKQVAQAARNIPSVSTLPANSLNVMDLLMNDCVIMTKGSVDFVTRMYK